MQNLNARDSLNGMDIHFRSPVNDVRGETTDLAGEAAIPVKEFGFSEGGLMDALADPEYEISNAVTGFGAWAAGHIHREVEQGFPRMQSLAYVAGKRVFDVLFSAVALAIVSPLMLVIALAIKLTSPGPVLFRQDRIGRNGIFKMLKFRSMYLNDCSDTHHTTVDDPRITWVGTLLRRTSLDEVPQLFNVVSGDMSIVGPRPELVKFVKRFSTEIPNYMARHRGKGGITGWAQVNGFRGSETSIPVRIEYDLTYLENWTFWLDIKIILLTVYKGLFRNAF